jgi:hypothetical protein
MTCDEARAEDHAFNFALVAWDEAGRVASVELHED